jgi:flagellar hook-associated protein 2
LVALKQKPLAKLETQATTVNAKISAMASLKTAVSNLQDQVTKLTSGSLWAGKTISSSLSAAVSGTVTDKAVAGTYAMSVTQLAATQNVNSAPLGKDDTMGTGVLTIRLGAWSTNGSNADVFSQNDDISKNIVLDDLDGSETLSDIAAKINAKNAGVSATIVRDGSGGERLSLTSTLSGVANGFEVVVDGADPSSNLQKLAYAGPNSTSGGMVSSRLAQDTIATINGIEVSSANETLVNVIDGVSLTLSQVTEPGKTVSLTIAQDLASAKKAVQDFATSYSSLMQTLDTMMAYDKDSGKGGTLQGDATARNLQSALRRMIQNPGGIDAGFTSISQLGVQITSKGTLEVNDEKLTAALKQPDAMKKFFSVDAEGVDQDGWAVRAHEFTKGLLGADGAFSAADDSLKARLKTNADQQARMSRGIAAYEDNLRRSYSALDSKMAQMDTLNNYVTQQIAQWNKSSN